MMCLIIDHLGNNSGNIKTETEEVVHGVILCKQVYAIPFWIWEIGNQNKLEQNSFYFGKYSEKIIILNLSNNRISLSEREQGEISEIIKAPK